MMQRGCSSTSLRRAVAVVAAVALAACASSTYRVRHRELLVQEIDGGMPVLRRDGRTFDGAPIGPGLTAAVAGVPKAEQMANASSESMMAFLNAYVGGAAALASGAALFTIGQFENDGGPAFNVKVASGSTLAVAGLVSLGVSFWYATQAAALRVDAVNAYNDAVIDRLRRRLRPLPPPATPSLAGDASATSDE